jgi:hypothetical protein
MSSLSTAFDSLFFLRSYQVNNNHSILHNETQIYISPGEE